MKKNGNPTTLVSLKEFLEQRLDDLEEKLELRHRLQQIAIDKAEVRSDLLFKTLEDKVEAQEQFVNRALGAITFIAFAIPIALHFL